MAYPTIINRIAELVRYQLPFFIRENYENFIIFLEAYYEWMETKYKNDINALYGSTNLLNFSDLDKTLNEFIKYFTNEFLIHIPEQILCNKKILLKNIKNFYRSRGNEKSFKLLFRIMFLDKINFYYPAIDILRPDDGKWILKQSIRCIRPNNVNVFDLNYEFLGKKIIGYRSGASGVVDYIVEYNTGSNKIYEIFFKKNSIYGHFQPWETISLNNTNTNKLQIQPILTNITIDYGGFGYSYNNKITITNPYNIKMEAVIKEIDSNGQILNIQILNPSFGYPIYPTTLNNNPIIHFEDFGPKTAIATAILGAIFEYPGYYVNTDGFLDSPEKLRDDYFYQEFSYVLKTHTNKINWYDIIQKLVHPAGTLVFNNLLIEPENVFIGPKLIPGQDHCIVTLNYFPEILNVNVNIPPNSLSFNAEIKDSLNSEYTTLGSSYTSINQNAFRNIPSQLFPSNLLKMTNNYLINYANYSLYDLADLKLNQLIRGTKQTPLQPRSTITVGFHAKGTIKHLGVGLEDILLQISGSGINLETTTNSFGEFFFDALNAGSYEIVPIDINWEFYPPFKDINLSTENINDADFIAETP